MGKATIGTAYMVRHLKALEKTFAQTFWPQHSIRTVSYRSPSFHVLGFKTVMLVAKEKAIARPAIKNAPKDITIVCALDRYQYCGAPSQNPGRTDAKSPGHGERIHPIYHT